jgi:hypothetical protein
MSLGYGAAALGVAVLTGAVLGCGSGDPSASATETSRSIAAIAKPTSRLAAPPVVAKIGSTFEVRVRFARALSPSKDGTGAAAEFSIGPSATDHAPVKMKGSTGFCYRQTLYNDFGRASLRRLHAGSRATLEIDIHGQLPKIVLRVTLASDVDATPRGCVLSPNPGPG